MAIHTANIKIASSPPPTPSAIEDVPEDPTDCAICCDDFNMSTKKKVKCPYCDYCACKTCVRQYLTTTTKEPHCMNCKKAWGQNFLVIQLDRSYNNKEYKNHRKSVLLDGEISKLPETMEAAQHFQKREELQEENRKLHEIETELRKRLREIGDTVAANQNTIYRIGAGQYKKGEEKRKFIMACPDENCRGFLSSSYKCELCKLFTCSKCCEIIGDKKDNPHHVCNPDSVKTTELIKAETKPCPSCGCRIYKISGCDQMWCTECHIAFSWRTGLRETGIIHNPHFYQWQRDENGGEAPRVPGDDPCGHHNHMPNWWDFRRQWLQNILVEHIRENYQGLKPFVLAYMNAPAKYRNYNLRSYFASIPEKFENYSANLIKRAFTEYLTEVYRRMQEIIYENRRIDDKIQELGDNQEIRIHYLLKKISKDDMGTKIIRRDTLRRKAMEMGNIYDLLATVGRETFHSITELDLREDPEAIAKACEFLRGLSNLRTYCNQQFELISVSYNCKVPFIHPNWFEEKKSYKLSAAKKKAEKKPKKKAEGGGEGAGEGSFAVRKPVDQSLPKDIIDYDEETEQPKFEFTIRHLFNENDFSDPEYEGNEVFKAAMTIHKDTTKHQLQKILNDIFLEISEGWSCEWISKKQAKMPFTVVTLSCGETRLVKHREPEYMCYNYLGEALANRENNAFEWMSEENEITIRWYGSRIDEKKLTVGLNIYYETRNHFSKISKMSIEEAVINDNKDHAYYLAKKSGKSETSDTLEGRVLQGDWDDAIQIAKNRVDKGASSVSSCTTV